MKFKFRLDTLLRFRKIEQDVAQREYSVAHQSVRDQLAHIKKLYSVMDSARERIELLQHEGGACGEQIGSVEQFIEGQKKVIEIARHKARELMQIEEEKHEVLVFKMQEHKVLDKIKDNKKEEFRKVKNKKLQKITDEIVTMRFKNEVES